MLVSVTGCTQYNSSSTVPAQEKKQLIIDLDKKLNIKGFNGSTRGDSNLRIEEPLYIGDNDEVIIKGNFLIEKSPISIKIGDHDEISFNGDSYTILNTQLQQGDLIQMRDNNKQLFLELEIIK